MRDGVGERFCLYEPAVGDGGRHFIVHKAISVVLMETHIVHKADIMGCLGGVMGSAIEVDLPDVSDMVRVPRVVAGISFWHLQSGGWHGRVMMHNQGFLRCRILKLFPQGQGGGRALNVILQPGGYHEGSWARRVD